MKKVIKNFINKASKFIDNTGWKKGLIIICFVCLFSSELSIIVLQVGRINNFILSLLLTEIFSFMILNNVVFGIFLKRNSETVQIAKEEKE